jgi:hypothetical protein
MVGRVGGFSLTHLVNRLETSDTTPTVTGFTWVAVGGTVAVTINGTTYTATVQSDHSWSVTTSTLSAGWYDVMVSAYGTDTITDSSGDVFVQPDSAAIYLPADTSVLFSDVLYVIYDHWAFHDGASGLDDHVWSL